MKLKESRSVTCLELEIECSTSATQEVFVEWETAPLETVPLTDELMQTKVLKDTRNFGT